MSTRSEEADNVLLTLDGTYLSLAGQKLVSIPKLSDKKSPQNELLVDIVETLDVSLNYLSDISNIIRFKKLKSVILDHNYLSHGDFKILQPLETVTTLWLNNNNITELDVALRVLSRAFPNLAYLSLLRNPCCPNNFIEDQKEAYQQYRRFVVSVFPKLEVLDAHSVTEQDRASKDTSADLPKFENHLTTSPLRKDVMSFVKTKEGYLTVATNTENVRWKPSWCVLGDCMLLHYRSKESTMPERVIGLEGYKVITVEGTDIIKSDKPLFAFQLKHEKKECVYLLSETKETMQDWLYYVNEQIKFAAVSKKSEAEQRRAQYEILEEERRKYWEEEEKRIKQELEDRFRSVTQQTHFVAPQEIKLVRVLGHGSFGTVYQGIVRSKEVAIKILHNRDLDEDAIDDFCNEVEIISKMHHPQVMLFLGASTQPGALMIIFELMKCDLEALLLNKERKLSLLTKLRLAKDAALGMAWLHGAEPMIIHRDVKTRNFLVDENLRVVVSDFGFAEKLRQGHSTYDDRGTWKGTSFFMAPEVLTGSQFNEKSDVYSFAIVLWEIYCRQRVYLDLVGSDIRKFIKMISFDGFRPPIPADCPKSYVQLLQACWAHDADQRPGFEEIVRMINQLIIEQAISDVNGRKFWEENFADKDRIQWKTFYQAIKPLLSAIDDRTLTTFKLFLVRKYNNEAHSKNDEYVLIERFGKLLEWFGPLHPSNDIISRMMQLVRQKWFHGDLTAHESLTCLMDKAPGTYLVRLGHTVGRFTLCYVDQDRIIHCHSIEKRAHIENDEKVVEELILEGRSDMNIYSSLEGLIAAQSYLSEPCTGNPYLWLFHPVTYVAHSLLDDSFDTLEPTYFVREKN